MRDDRHRRAIVAAILIAGLLLSWLLVAFTLVFMKKLEQEAILRQRMRASAVAEKLDDEILITEQIARAAAALVVPTPQKDRGAIEQTLLRVLGSTSPEYVYGIGAWYEPHTFSPGERYFGPYAHRAPAAPSGMVLTYEWTTASYDFHHRPWYRAGIEGRGTPVFLEPYFDTDFVYMTVAEAILDQGGAPIGVVSVDMLLPQLRQILAQARISEHEAFHVLTPKGAVLAHSDEAALLAWARESGRETACLLDLDSADLAAFEAHGRPGGVGYTVSLELPKTGWTLSLVSERAWLFADVARFRGIMLAAAGALWIGDIAACLGVRRSLRLRDLARELEQRRVIQATLRESERRLRAVLEGALHAVVGMDHRGTIVDWNLQAELIFGWSRQEALGRSLVETIVPERLREAQKRGLEASAATAGGPWLNRHLETSALRRDGTEFPIEVIVTSIPGEEGPIYYSFMADITERRCADAERQRLLEEQQRLLAHIQRRSAELQAMLDSMVDGVVTCDASRRITLINNAGLYLLGLSPGEPYSLEDVAARVEASTPDGQVAEPRELPLQSALSGVTVTEGSLVLRVLGRQTSTYLRASAAPIRDEQGQIVAAVAVLRDVTESVELNHLKDQFVKVAAHELKTPVTILKSYAQLALRQGDDNPLALRRMLEAINRGADRIDRIARDLLDVSQLYLGRLKLAEDRIDLRELLEQAVHQASASAPKHRIHLDAERSIVVHGDRERLAQVLLGLLDNAIRYSPSGGDVDVSLSVGSDEVVVTVEDHGIGIPADKQSRIFERFYRAHSGTPHDYGGMGVGLFIAAQIVARYGGRMWFESREGEGSRFMFSLSLRAGEGRST